MGLNKKGCSINDERRMKETVRHMHKNLKYITPFTSSTIFGYPMIQRSKLCAEQ